MIQIKLLDDNFTELEKRIRAVEKTDAFVGYDRNESGIHEESKLPYADLIAILSAGVSSKNMPARPIFRYAMKSYDIKASSLRRDLKKYLSNIGSPTPAISLDKVYTNWAKGFSKEVLDIFGENPPLAKNSEETIARKGGRNTPLVDTEDLKDNLGYSIGDKPMKLVKTI